MRDQGTDEIAASIQLIAGRTAQSFNRRKARGGAFWETANMAENLLAEREDREISTRELGEFLMERLRVLDQVAYVRFASVYRRFEDVEEFMAELKGLLEKDRERKKKKNKK